MRHFANPDFWKCYEQLSASLQALADKNFALLKENPDHPSLHFKKVASYWSVRVSGSYRALAVQTSDGFIWFWIGKHDEYDQIIQS